MKILLYGLNYAPEPVGIGKYTGELATWLAQRGHQVRVITAPPYFPRWRVGPQNEESGRIYRNRYLREELHGVQVQRCPLWVPRQPSGLTRLLHLASFALSSAGPLLAQWRWQPDVVISVAPAFFCAPGALLLSALCGSRTCSWLHVQDFELDAAFELGLLQGGWLRRLAEAFERRILQGFSRTSSISQAMVQRLHAKGVEPSRTLHLPNWVDLEQIQPQSPSARAQNPYRRFFGLSEEHTVLLYSGSMNQKQGLDVLVEVIRSLADRPDLVWLLAGEGPSKAALQEATHGMANVHLLPLQPHHRMNDWLNAADIHLLPQKAGAADLVLPSKLLGMLASGRPVIATSPIGTELAALSAEAGLCVAPEDPESFGHVVVQLAEQRALREAKGRKARQLAELWFCRDAVLQELESSLHQVVEAAAARSS